MATIFRAPIIIRLPVKPKAPATWEVNLLALLQPNPAQPFSQLDWPLPKRARPPQKSDAPANINPLFYPNPAQPFVQSEWSNPYNVRLSQRIIDHPAIQEVAVVAAPFVQSEWPNPAHYMHKAQDAAPQSRLLPLATVPFANYDWPLSSKSKAAASGHFNSIFTAPEAPFFVTDWPNPARKRPTRRDDAIPNLTFTLAPPTVPFSYHDWPNPKRRGKAQHTDVPPYIIPEAPPVPSDFKQGLIMYAYVNRLMGR